MEFEWVRNIAVFNKLTSSDSHGLGGVLTEIREGFLLEGVDDKKSLVSEVVNLDEMEIEYERLLFEESDIYGFTTFIYIVLSMSSFLLTESIYSVFLMIMMGVVICFLPNIDKFYFKNTSNIMSFLTSKNCYKSLKKIEDSIAELRKAGYIEEFEKKIVIAQDLLVSTPQIASRFEDNKVFLEKIKGYIVNIQTVGEDDKKGIRSMFYLNHCNKKLNGLLEELTFYRDSRKVKRVKKVKKDKVVSNVKLL